MVTSFRTFNNIADLVFYFMDEKADNGRVISKRMLKLKKNSNALNVYKQLVKIGKKQVR